MTEFTNLQTGFWFWLNFVDLEEKAKAEAAKGNKTLQSLLSYFSFDKAKNKEEGFTIGFGDWCRCMCCPRPEERPSEFKTAQVISAQVLFHSFL